MQSLQQAIMKHSAKTEIKSPTYSSDYVARGMGLFMGEQLRKTSFYIYSYSECPSKGVRVNIRGPYKSFAESSIPPFQNNCKKLNTKTNMHRKRQSLFYSISKDLAQFMHHSSIKNDIPIKVEMEEDRAKVTFIPTYTGIYQISLTSNGDLLNGSPFTIRVNPNESGLHDSFDTPNTPPNGKSKIVTKRKILCKVIDFIDEKLVLKNDQDLNKYFISRNSENLLIEKTEKQEKEFIETKSATHFNKGKKNEASSVCNMHIAQEACMQKSFTSESTEFSSSSEKENDRRTQKLEKPFAVHRAANEGPIPNKIFQERREYWAKLTAGAKRQQFRSMPSGLNLIQRANVTEKSFKSFQKSFSCSSNILNSEKPFMDRKLDFDYSEDRINEDSILTVRDRKEILLERLTDEQKLQLEKKFQKEINTQNQKTSSIKRSLSKQSSINSLSDKIEAFEKRKSISSIAFSCC